MPTEYKCPSCGSTVLVPNVASKEISRYEEMGCNNIEQHEDNEAIVMWENE
jgi:hypothetical protein